MNIFKIAIFGIILASSFSISLSANPLEDSANWDRAGYCSAYARGGRWATWFGTGSTYESCRRVENNLYPARPVDRVQGYYSLRGFNTVVVRCRYYRDEFWGVGAEPAERAYDSALYNNAQSCLFVVR